jgi:hypothetical protein
LFALSNPHPSPSTGPEKIILFIYRPLTMQSLSYFLLYRYLGKTPFLPISLQTPGKMDKITPPFCPDFNTVDKLAMP